MTREFYLIVDERAFMDPEQGVEFVAASGWKDLKRECAKWPGAAVVEVKDGGRRVLVGGTDYIAGEDDDHE